jgi:hypothetical protein
MRNRLVTLIVAIVAILVLSLPVLAQGQRAGGGQRGGGGAAPAAQAGGGRGQRGLNEVYEQRTDVPFQPHDIAGIWSRNSGGYGGGGTCPDCGDRGYAGGSPAEFPTFTPEGQKRFDLNKPSYGRALGSADANAHPEEHIGRRRAVPPANDTDPYQHCNPMGVTRANIYPDPLEILQLPDRIIIQYEWGYGTRTIWMDGRKALAEPDLPRWWGYSAGRWEGNTLVIETTGNDDRTWIDHFGYPHSDQEKIEERWTRTNYNTIELRMTITDPVVYTKPWASQLKRFHLIPKDRIPVTTDGWKGLLEDLCAPADEVDQFNKRIRDPAGGVVR